jgi:hypothetical protein
MLEIPALAAAMAALAFLGALASRRAALGALASRRRLSSLDHSAAPNPLTYKPEDKTNPDLASSDRAGEAGETPALPGFPKCSCASASVRKAAD